MMVDRNAVEIVPAILRATWEGIQEDWQRVANVAGHIQIDITDGIFAGEGTFRDVRQFKKLPKSQKIELHLMVHTPANFVDDIIDLNPARCIFHIESFTGTNSIALVYRKLREQTQSELALALNPDSPNQWLEEQLPLLDYVMFMGYSPGWANQPIQTIVYKKIAEFRAKHPDIPIAVDGHISKETVPAYVEAGARILCANTSVFGHGSPAENIEQLRLLAEQYLS
jgi:pentose-5-phosphate-3-epimerase